MAKIMLLILLITGCTHQVLVPIPPIEPPIITRPDLDIFYLKPGDDAGVVIQAHRLSILKLQSWGLQLEEALNSYRTSK